MLSRRQTDLSQCDVCVTHDLFVEVSGDTVTCTFYPKDMLKYHSVLPVQRRFSLGLAKCGAT